MMTSGDGDLPEEEPRASGREPVARIEHDLAFLVRGLERIYRQRNYPVDRAQYLLLLKLCDAPRTSGDLAGQLGLDHSTVTRQVAGLERAQCVTRVANPQDGRSTIFLVTPLGRKRCAEMRRMRIKGLEQALSDWSVAERREFAALIARFNETVRNVEDPSLAEKRSKSARR